MFRLILHNEITYDILALLAEGFLYVAMEDGRPQRVIELVDHFTDVNGGVGCHYIVANGSLLALAKSRMESAPLLTFGFEEGT